MKLENHSLEEVGETISSSRVRMAPINSRLLRDCSAAGRYLLAYMIDKCEVKEGNGTLVILNKLHIMEWYTGAVGPSYASSHNVNRGIKELERLGVIAKLQDGNSTYSLNLQMLNLVEVI